EIAHALAEGDLGALYLLHVDPLRTHPDRPVWEAALTRASGVVAHASVLTEGIAEHADVVFPAESYAEKDGTVTHPDGRLQRLGPFRSLWAAPECEASPALKFLTAGGPRAELSPADAERLGVADGDRVRIAHDGVALDAEVALRSAVPPGTVFVAEAIPGGGA